MASRNIFTLIWTDEILDEYSRNKIKNGSSSETIFKTCEAIKWYFARSQVLKEDYEADELSLIKTKRSDRHVLSAAAQGGAEYLVTFNLKDFDQTEALARNLILIHPDDFLVLLVNFDPNAIYDSLYYSRNRLQNPHYTAAGFAELLNISKVSNFSKILKNNLAEF
jgi:hypothetical protein